MILIEHLANCLLIAARLGSFFGLFLYTCTSFSKDGDHVGRLQDLSLIQVEWKRSTT